MKIGILTFHYPENRNYGALLQLYALYTIVKRLGHKPYVINYQFWEKPKVFTIKLYEIVDYIFTVFPFEIFSRKYLLNKTQRVNTHTANILNNKIDTFIVGSDQVWRYKYIDNIYDFFFAFVDDNHRKISYAASFGIDTWSEAPYEATENIKKLLKRFHAVSVREESGVSICKQLEKDAIMVLDPVFLLSRQDYNKLISSKQNNSKGTYIAKLLFDEHPECTQTIKSFSDYLKLSIVDLNGLKIPLINTILRKHSVRSWLKYIRDSRIVITDSFHCTAFCLIFNKPFICVLNKSRGIARLESLLKIVGLKDRMLTPSATGIDEFIMLYNKVIDYTLINEELQPYKEKSLHFLIENLV